MQTFIPVPSFTETAKILDYRRLGKQRVEAKQLLIIVTGRNKTSAWTKHPAAIMWMRYPNALYAYMEIMCKEWIQRGYNSTLHLTIRQDFADVTQDILANGIQYPPWLGDPALHASHRAALLFKEPKHYAQFNWAEKPELNYIWPGT